MTKKPIIINAFHGLGDIIFSIPIYRELIAQGHKVIHPYLEVYGPIWKHWPEISWIPKDALKINYDNKQVVENDFYKILPMRWQEKAGEIMRSKYDYMGMDFMKWREVTWVRDEQSEQALFNFINKPDPGEPYILVNETFQHDDRGKVRIKRPEGMKVITMTKVPGFTLMDWGKVMENATEIHTAGTSINYLLDPDFLNVKCPIHLYIRRPKEKDFSTYNYLLKKDYIFHNE